MICTCYNVIYFIQIHIHLVFISCYFCLEYFCFEILYESSLCRCFVFVELYIHFFLLHCRWDQMVLISFLLFRLLLHVIWCCYLDQYLGYFELYFLLFLLKHFHDLTFLFEWLFGVFYLLLCFVSLHNHGLTVWSYEFLFHLLFGFDCFQ